MMEQSAAEVECGMSGSYKWLSLCDRRTSKRLRDTGNEQFRVQRALSE